MDSDKRKLFGIVCHVSIFFNVTLLAIGVPIAFLLVSDDEVVKANARESLNFHLNMWFYWGTVWVLTFFLIGFLLWPMVALFNLILPIVAIVKILGEPNTPYKYPFFIIKVF